MKERIRNGMFGLLLFGIPALVFFLIGQDTYAQMFLPFSLVAFVLGFVFKGKTFVKKGDKE